MNIIIDATRTYQLVFHGEDLLDRYAFEKIPDGKHVVRGEIKDETGAIVRQFDWPVIVRNGCLYVSSVTFDYAEPWRFVST